MKNKEFVVLTIERNRKRKIFIDEILYCKADNSYTLVALDNSSKYIISKPIKEFETILNHFNFYRISRSLIVNITHCVELKTGSKPEILLTNTEVVIPDKNKIPIIEEKMFVIQTEPLPFTK